MRKSVIMGAATAIAIAAPAGATPADFKAKADALLRQAYPADGPGAAVIVTDDSKVVYEGSRGLADVAAKRPITPDTVFRMGSITKQFSAAVMLQLVAEGKVSLDDKLSKFFPDYPKPGADATVAQLLNHTVGVQSYTSIPGWMVEQNTNRAYSTEDMIAQFRNLPSPSKPGEKWDYNNSGYVLVGAVIEKVTGKPWHVNVDERIARPLGLTTIRYGVLENETPHMARGYTERAGKVADAQKIHMSVPHAAGALIGSVEDLAKWNDALRHGKVIPAEQYAKMNSPTLLPDGSTAKYGFGMRMSEVRSHPALGHGGGIFGFSTASIYLPKEDVFVAVFANSDAPKTSPDLLMLKLAALAVDDPFPSFKPVALDPKAVEPWVGLYKLDEGERRIFVRDGKLFTQRAGGGELEALAAGNGKYFYKDSLTWFELKRDPAGTPMVAMYPDGAATPELSTRAGPIPADLPAADVPQATLASYAGRYDTPVGPLTVALSPDGQMTVKLGEQQAIPVLAVSQTEFRLTKVDARIVFQVEGGKVVGAVIKQGGRELPAKRVD
jgi:CubicO group peptidase (beta-lactamase class C family)